MNGKIWFLSRTCFLFTQKFNLWVLVFPEENRHYVCKCQKPPAKPELCMGAQFQGSGTACLVRVAGSVTAEKYQAVLFGNLLPYLKSSLAMTITQDNASVRTFHLIRDFFYPEGIVVMNWPAKSPDSNPIENIRETMGQSIKRQLFINPEQLQVLVIW